MHFLLLYDCAPDYLARRDTHRGAHLRVAWQAHERGDLVLGGALVDPIDGAMLLFQGKSAKIAEDFARADPYVLNGLVTSWRVRQWATVVGSSAAAPLRPEELNTAAPISSS